LTKKLSLIIELLIIVFTTTIGQEMSLKTKAVKFLNTVTNPERKLKRF